VSGYTAGLAEKSHGRGLLFMDWRTDWDKFGPTSSLNVTVYTNPTSLSKHTYLKIGKFSVDTTFVNVNVYTVAGEFVKSFSMQDLNSANGTIEWNLKNQDGKKIAPGVYFLIVQTNEGKFKQKLAVTK
jgi:flagellar hook assembly protein FlgD